MNSGRGTTSCRTPRRAAPSTVTCLLLHSIDVQTIYARKEVQCVSIFLERKFRTSVFDFRGVCLAIFRFVCISPSIVVIFFVPCICAMFAAGFAQFLSQAVMTDWGSELARQLEAEELFESTGAIEAKSVDSDEQSRSQSESSSSSAATKRRRKKKPFSRARKRPTRPSTDADRLRTERSRKRYALMPIARSLY